jgi:hypothetical protein
MTTKNKLSLVHPDNLQIIDDFTQFETTDFYNNNKSCNSTYILEKYNNFNMKTHKRKRSNTMYSESDLFTLEKPKYRKDEKYNDELERINIISLYIERDEILKLNFMDEKKNILIKLNYIEEQNNELWKEINKAKTFIELYRCLSLEYLLDLGY